MAKRYTTPRFEPSKHGFQFNNNFKNFNTSVPIINLPLPPGLQFETKGRCGGMAAAAADHFLARRVMPTETVLPVDGDVLGDYILQRQLDSFLTVGPDILAAAVLIGEASAAFGKTTPPNGIYWKGLKSFINLNRPCPIAYIPEGYNLSNLGSGHQVLAIGYSEDKKEVYAYDPNHKNEEITLRQTSNRWKAYRPGSTTAEHTLMAWIPDGDWSAVDPKNIYDGGGAKNFNGRDLRAWVPPSNQDLQKYSFVQANLSGNPHLSSCDFQNVDASFAFFTQCRLVKCDFRDSTLKNAMLIATDLTGSTLSKAKMQSAQLVQAVFNNTVLNGADATGASFRRSRFLSGTFHGATLKGANFSETALDGTTFKTFNDNKLANVNFTQAALNNVEFTGGDLDFGVFTRSALAGVEFDDVDLTGAQFRDAALNGVSFKRIRGWSGSLWSNASLRNCTFDNPALHTHIRQQGGRF